MRRPWGVLLSVDMAEVIDDTRDLEVSFVSLDENNV